MQQFELDLEIGETIRLGSYTFTLLDIDGERVDVRIDEDDEFGFDEHPAFEFTAH